MSLNHSFRVEKPELLRLYHRAKNLQTSFVRGLSSFRLLLVYISSYSFEIALANFEYASLLSLGAIPMLMEARSYHLNSSNFLIEQDNTFLALTESFDLPSRSAHQLYDIHLFPLLYLKVH